MSIRNILYKKYSFISNWKNILEKDFETAHKMLISKKMDLEKSEYLSNVQGDSFIEPIRINIIPKKDKVKYLGQYINKDGNAFDQEEVE